MPALRAHERAMLFLHDFKDGVTTDPYEQPVPAGIEREFERLMAIIRFVNGELADCVRILKEQVTQAELRLNWLEETHRHAGDLWILGNYLDEACPNRSPRANAESGRASRASAATSCIPTRTPTRSRHCGGTAISSGRSHAGAASSRSPST
ncbi:MAG: hypothetical protein WEB52_00500 [Dehalococcoidia bacterium]